MLHILDIRTVCTNKIGTNDGMQQRVTITTQIYRTVYVDHSIIRCIIKYVIFFSILCDTIATVNTCVYECILTMK